jgi:hypothetical protein
MSVSWYRFIGAGAGDRAGMFSDTGDFDGDGLTDFLIGAERADGSDGRAYLVSGADLADADAADGTSDRIIDLGNVAAQSNSYEFTAPFAAGSLGVGMAALDADGDGNKELWIGARFADPDAVGNPVGALYVIETDDLFAYASNGTVDLSAVTSDRTAFDESYLLIGEPGTSQAGNGLGVADLDGDGTTDWIISAPAGPGRVFVLNGNDVPAAASDGVIQLGDVAALPGSYRIEGVQNSQFGGYPSVLGDISGTGADSIALSADLDDKNPGTADTGAVYVFSGADLAAAAGSGGMVSVTDLPLTGEGGFAITGDAQGDRLSLMGKAGIPDLDGDGLPELGLFEMGDGAAHLVMSSELPAGGTVDIGTVLGTPGSQSYTFVGPTGSFRIAAVGDLTGGPETEIAISAFGPSDEGTTWVVSLDDLYAAGFTDGGTIALEDITQDRATWANSYRLDGAAPGDRAITSVLPVAADTAPGGDLSARMLIGAFLSDEGGAADAGALYLFSGDDIVNSANSDGVIDLGDLFLCFAHGTRIAVPGGTRPVEALRLGDLVETLDRGPQPVVWTGQVVHPAQGRPAPVVIRAGALGPGVPARDLWLSPQHRVMLSGKVVARMFGCDEVLAPVCTRTAIPGIERVERAEPMRYVHLLLDRHAILSAEGAPAESLLPGAMAMPALPPGLAADPIPARPVLTNREARNLALRLARKAERQRAAARTRSQCLASASCGAGLSASD